MTSMKAIYNIYNDLRDRMITNTLKVIGVRHGRLFINVNFSLNSRRIINEINRKLRLRVGCGIMFRISDERA